MYTRKRLEEGGHCRKKNFYFLTVRTYLSNKDIEIKSVGRRMEGNRNRKV
jgi:hypothetical protein